MGSKDSVYNISNVAMIPPIPDIHWTSQMTFHLCEAPFVLTSEKYAQYYKWHSDKGHYVILDNGAAAGGTVSDQQLIEAAEIVGASEVVVPDTMAESDATLARAKKFLRRWIGDTSTTLMFVPQGTDFSSWYQSLQDLVKIAEPNRRRIVIGIGKHMHARVPGGRYPLAVECLKLKLTCHILGASSEPLSDIDLLDHPAVRGSDTSLPFAMAQAGYKLLDDPTPEQWSLPLLKDERPTLDFLKSSEMLGRTNMEAYLGWVREYSRTTRQPR